MEGGGDHLMHIFGGREDQLTSYIFAVLYELHMQESPRPEGCQKKWTSSMQKLVNKVNILSSILCEPFTAINFFLLY